MTRFSASGRPHKHALPVAARRVRHVCSRSSGRDSRGGAYRPRGMCVLRSAGVQKRLARNHYCRGGQTCRDCCGPTPIIALRTRAAAATPWTAHAPSLSPRRHPLATEIELLLRRAVCRYTHARGAATVPIPSVVT